MNKVKYINNNVFLFLVYSYLVSVFIVILATSQPIIFNDSNRYFRLKSQFNFIFNSEQNSGSYLINFLFFLAQSYENAIFINSVIWLISVIFTLYTINKYRIIERNYIIYLSYISIAVIYTSSFVSSWTSTILSESIGISFFLSFTILGIAHILKIIKVPISILFLLLILIAISKPLWSLISFFIFFSAFKLKQNKLIFLNLAVLGVFVISSLLTQQNDYYTAQNLSKNGWYALTRVISDEKNFNYHLIEYREKVLECEPLAKIIDENKDDPTNGIFFREYEKALESCPLIVEYLNNYQFLEKLPSLYLNPKLFMYSIKSLFLNSAEPVLYSNAVLSFSKTMTTLYAPLLLLLLPGLLIISITSNFSKEYFKIFSILIANTLFGFFIIWIDGIEFSRHLLPITQVYFVSSFWLFCMVLLINNREKHQTKF